MNRNKLLAGLASFANLTGSGILLLEGLALWQRVACVGLLNAGTVLAAFFKMPAKTPEAAP